eukprot:6486872-Amphidinium_carterae.1
MSEGRNECKRQIATNFALRADEQATLGKESVASQLLIVWEAPGAGKTTLLATLPELLAECLEQDLSNITVVPVTYNQRMNTALKTDSVDTAVALRMSWATLRCMGGEPEGCGLKEFYRIDAWAGKSLKVEEVLADVFPAWYPPSIKEGIGKRSILITVDELSKLRPEEVSKIPSEREDSVRVLLSNVLDMEAFRHVFLCFSAVSREWRKAVVRNDGLTRYSGRLATEMELYILSIEYVLEVLKDLFNKDDNLDKVLESNLVLIAASKGGWPRVLSKVVDWLQQQVSEDPTVLADRDLGYTEVWRNISVLTNGSQGTILPHSPRLSDVDAVLKCDVYIGSKLTDAIATWASMPGLNQVLDLLRMGSLVVELVDGGFKLDIPAWYGGFKLDIPA